MPWAGAAWEGWVSGKRPALWVLCCFPILVLLRPRSHSSHIQPSTCLGQATELLTSSGSPPALQTAPLPSLSSHPRRLRFRLMLNPTGRPCDTVGTLCGLLSLLSPDNKGRVPKRRSGPPGRRREGTKGAGTCPVPAQQRPSNLTFSPGLRAGWQPGHQGMPPMPSCASFGEWCLMAGVCWWFRQKCEEMKTAHFTLPHPNPFQSQSLMQKVQEAPGYHHVCGSSCHCWAGASAWHLLVTSWVGLASRQRPLTECWMKEAFLLHLCGEKQGRRGMRKQ